MTITEDTTVELQYDGQTSGPIAVERLGEAAERLRRRRQLTFDIGGATPDMASVKIGGDLGVGRDLRKGSEFTVSVTDEDGEIVARGTGLVTSVAFKDKRNKHGDIESTERIHTITLG